MYLIHVKFLLWQNFKYFYNFLTLHPIIRILKDNVKKVNETQIFLFRFLINDNDCAIKIHFQKINL